MRVGELLFWGSFAEKYKPFGESRIQFGESDTFWQNLKRFGETPIQSGKTLYNLAKVGSFAKLYRVLPNRMIPLAYLTMEIRGRHTHK